MFFEHNFGHNTRFFWVTLKSIILEFSSIMYLTLVTKPDDCVTDIEDCVIKLDDCMTRVGDCIEEETCGCFSSNEDCLTELDVCVTLAEEFVT